jgi:hypothetical protein
MHTRLSQGSLRRVAESMIDDFGAGAEAEVEARIARAATQNLPTIADAWRRVKRLVSELRHGADGESPGDNARPSNL